MPAMQQRAWGHCSHFFYMARSDCHTAYCSVISCRTQKLGEQKQLRGLAGRFYSSLFRGVFLSATCCRSLLEAGKFGASDFIFDDHPALFSQQKLETTHGAGEARSNFKAWFQRRRRPENGTGRAIRCSFASKPVVSLKYSSMATRQDH